MSVRLLASYCREWKTEGAADPHKLRGELMDFHEPYEADGQRRFWNCIWNFVPQNGTNYTWFVTAHPAGRIAANPFCEVGCPYAVRGFDYDYVGILWLDDLLWRHHEWQINLNVVHESGSPLLSIEQGGRMPKMGRRRTKYLQRTVQAYRILFTRALKGVYVWVPDPENRQHLEESLS